MFKKTSKIHTEEPAKPEEASKALESVNEHSRYTLPKDRRCHDCFCTILFLVWWVGMAGIAMVGLTTGKPERLLYGSDYTGVPCTADQVIYYPRMNQDIVDATQSGTSVMDISFYGICVPKCPAKSTYICDYETQAELTAKGLTGAALEAAQKSQVDVLFNTGPCWQVPLASSTVMFRCFPSKNETSTQEQRCVNDELDIFYEPESPSECNPVNATAPIVLEGRTIQPGGCLHYDRVLDKTKPYGTYKYEPNTFCETMETLTTTRARGPTADNPLIDRLQDTAVLVGAWAGDLEKTMVEIVLAGGALALVLGVLWLLLLKYCTSCIIWTTLTLVVGSMVCCSLYCSYLAGMLGTQFERIVSQYEVVDAGLMAKQSQDQSNKRSYEVLAYLLWIATFVLTIVVVFLRSKVKISIGIIREASKSLQAIPALIVWPFLPFVLALLLFLYFCGIAGYVFSAGSITVNDISVATAGVNFTALVTSGQAAAGAATGAASAASGGALNVTAGSLLTTVATVDMKKYESTNAMQYMLWYHLFGFLWANALINAVSMCTVAGAVSAYYWARHKKIGPVSEGAMGENPIRTALYCCFRYHFGSLCFGSAIVAIVQFVRILLMYIDRQTKDLQKTNIAIKIFMKAVHCCMWCLEKIIKFVTKNAYIVVAMKGTSFCTSTFRAFRLIFANLAQVGVLAGISNTILLLVKLTITGGCGLIMFALVDSSKYKFGGEKELSAPLLPVLVVLLLAFSVSTIFLNAFGLAIDTILLCFCEDKKENKPGEYYMSEEMQKCIPGFKKAQAEAKAVAARDAANANAEAEAGASGAAGAVGAASGAVAAVGMAGGGTAAGAGAAAGADAAAAVVVADVPPAEEVF